MALCHGDGHALRLAVCRGGHRIRRAMDQPADRLCAPRCPNYPALWPWLISPNAPPGRSLSSDRSEAVGAAAVSLTAADVAVDDVRRP